MIDLKNILTEEEICQKFNVTAEEIDRASRVIDCADGSIFYQVTSRSGGDDHIVRYNKEFQVLTCTCKAGQNGVKCWARRAAQAAAFEYRQNERVAMAKEEEAARAASHKRIQAEAQAAVDEKMAAYRKQAEATTEEYGFSFLRK